MTVTGSGMATGREAYRQACLEFVDARRRSRPTEGETRLSRQ